MVCSCELHMASCEMVDESKKLTMVKCSRLVMPIFWVVS